MRWRAAWSWPAIASNRAIADHDAQLEQLASDPFGAPEAVATPIYAPKANSIAERVIGTLRRECLDHVMLLDEQHRRSVLAEFVRYYNQERPHRTLGLRPAQLKVRPTTGSVRARPVLNGLHHVYERAA